jgi:hypothetical protein
MAVLLLREYYFGCLYCGPWRIYVFDYFFSPFKLFDVSIIASANLRARGNFPSLRREGGLAYSPRRKGAIILHPSVVKRQLPFAEEQIRNPQPAICDIILCIYGKKFKAR